MASLKRGVSFRRQGSSGLSWAENWTFTEDGMFQVTHRTPTGGEEVIVGKQIAHTSSGASTLPRSSSTGGHGGMMMLKMESCLEAAVESHQSKSRSGVLGWIKGRMKKASRRSS